MTDRFAPMSIPGVNYDTGTSYGSAPTRTTWRRSDVDKDMSDIKNRLGANSVCVYGSDATRLREAAQAAAAAGLDTWIQPRSIEGNTSSTATLVAKTAKDAESLARNGARVYLNVGCELSVFADGIMPGRDYAQRADGISTRWPLLPLYNRRLNRMLGVLVEAARSEFSGPLTYGGAIWESVDWRRFDFVGQNYYRLKYNERNYPKKVSRFHRHGKPVIITEFGCCAYTGADRLGPAGHEIIDFTADPPRLSGAPVRNEQAQAGYIAEMLEIYRQTEMTGAFVFEYLAEGHQRSDDPLFDLDMAGYGIVSPDRTPKAAYEVVAAAYRSP